MRKKLFFLSALMIFAVLATACGGNSQLVTVKEDIKTSFNLDVYNNKTKEIKVSDYFDVKEGADVRYVAQKSDGVNTTTVTNGKFTVTALSAGTSTVTLQAIVQGDIVASVTLTFTITDSTPLPVTISGIADGEQYTMSGAASSFQGRNYTFKVLPKAAYVVENEIKASYKIGNGAEKEIAGILDSQEWLETYVFTIPGSEIDDDITITGIKGLVLNTAQTVNVTGLDIISDEFKAEGASVAYVNKDYSFKVSSIGYYEVSAAYKVGSGETKELTAFELPDDEDGQKVYGFKIAKAELTADVDIDLDFTFKTKNFNENFFNPENWVDIVGQSGKPKPDLESDGSLKFVNTVIKVESAVNVISAVAIGTWETLSFNVKSADEFDIVLFCTSNTQLNSSGTAWRVSSDNWIRLSCSGGVLYVQTCQASQGRPLAKVPAEAGYVAGEWNRIDLAFTRTAETQGVLRVFVNGNRAMLEGDFEGAGTDPNVIIENGDFIFACNKPNYGGRAAVLAFDTPFYIKPVE